MCILRNWSIICSFVILLSPDVQSQSIDTLIHLYPLHVSDIWQYDWRMFNDSGPHLYYEIREITYDTIMPNGKKYFVFNSTRPISPYYTRMDTSTGIVYDWENNDEGILYDFNHSWYPRLDTILGIPTFAVNNGIIGDSHEFAYGFGIVTLSYEDVILYSAKLNYAKINGVEYGTRMSVSDSSLRPTNFTLSQNYPNPFNPTTTFSFAVSYKSHVRLTITNLLGQQIATVVDNEFPAGSYTQIWTASNLPSGIYFYQLKIDGRYTNVKKLVLLK